MFRVLCAEVSIKNENKTLFYWCVQSPEPEPLKNIFYVIKFGDKFDQRQTV